MIKSVAAALACGVCIVAIATPAQAQMREYRIPASSLQSALDAYARQSGRQVIYKVDEVRRARSPGANGNISAEAALAALLAGTGFRAQGDGSGAVAIVRTNGAGSLSTSPPSVVDTAAAQVSDPSDDLIVVTGSRIERSVEDSAVPLQILGSEDLQESGTVDLAEAVAELPGVGIGTSPQNSQNAVHAAGLSTIDLRRLGRDRTLVLINGKRAVSNAGSSNEVSLSTLPEGFVKRVEITTGGASAVYGSDAIAGVANFILEDDFEGVELNGRFLTPEASGGEDWRFSASVGKKFADDRGYILLAGSYRSVRNVLADATRPLSIRPVEWDDPDVSASNSFANEINTPGCDPGNEDKFCFVGSFSGSTPGGVFEGGDAWFKDGQWFNDVARNDASGFGRLPGDRNPGQDFYSDFDGYNSMTGITLSGGRELFNVGTNIAFEFSPAAKFSFVGLYSSVDSDTAGGYETLSDSDTFGSDGRSIGNIASTNPFIPDEVNVTRSGSVDFDRRLVELGVQNRRNNRETVRLITDVSGSLSSKWDYSTYATYGTFTQKQANLNELNFQKAQWALDVEMVGGQIQCRNATARAEGCVPLNIFGEGSISPQAADYIRYTAHSTQTNEQFTGGGFVRGDLFDNWAGTIKLVAGAEYRWEGKHNIGDPDGDPGGLDGDPLTDDVELTSHTPVESIKASYDVWEVFGELDVPLVTDMLDLQLAGRYADYSTVGGIFSYNAGLVFRPIDGLTFRGQYARSQRAPNLNEFFSTPRSDSDDLNDPCDGLRPDGTGLNPPSGPGGTDVNLATVAQNCLAEPGIQAYFADPANAGIPFDTPTSTQGPNAGNLNLKEESADSYTLGVVATPGFLRGLTLAVDYYNISIKDAIDSLSTQDTVDLCYASDDYPNNKFCDVITRNSAAGFVEEVINVQENLSRVKVEGVDASLFYNFEPGFIPGRFDVDLRYSHYFKNETKFVGLGGNVLTATSLGEIENPRDELRLKLGYHHQGFRIAYTMTYVGGGLDDINIADPAADNYFHVGGQDYHRIYASYDFGNDDQFRINVGVNNIFNDFGPFLPGGLDHGSSRTIASDLNDSTGREFYVGLRARF